MQFLENNWIWFVGVFGVFFLLTLINFIRTGRSVISGRFSGIRQSMYAHVILSGLCVLSAIPALLSIILAVIQYANRN